MDKAGLENLEKAGLAKLKDLFSSQKVQIFLLGTVLQLATVVGGIVAKRYGVDPALVEPLVEKLMVSLGAGTVTVIGAHSYVDANVTSANIAAEAGKSAKQVLSDLAAEELATLKKQVADQALQLATHSGQLAALPAAPAVVIASTTESKA